MVATTMTWLYDLGNRVGLVNHKRHCPNKLPTLGILAFEAARTMSRLVSLYKSLSEDEILKLRRDTMKSEGVCFLNSKDEGVLLKLACAERMEDLDRSAISVARLGKKCSDPGLNEFECAYADLKLGFMDISKMDFQSKEIEKIIDKMVKSVNSTSHLYAGLETLNELETMQRKSKRRKDQNGSVFSEEKLILQRQQVQNLKETSLWNQSFDRTVGFMARTVFIVYARMCVVFGPYIAVLPPVICRHVRFSSLQLQFNQQREPPPEEPPVKEVVYSKSGPLIPKPKGLLRFLSREPKPFLSDNNGSRMGVKENQDFRFGYAEKTSKISQQAPPTTVGGAGLALRYSNVIITVEKHLQCPSSISDYVRDDLYKMLPDSLRKSVMLKLKKLLRREDLLGEDDSLAEGWRDGLQVMLGWLSPMAHNTIRWMTERNFEKQNFDAKPRVLLLQTLVFADREKTEAAIVEVLVGLSCICRYEIRRRSFSNGS